MAIKIICHMITSLDGRIITSRWDFDPGIDVSPLYEGIASRFAAQGWIVGRTTMAEYADSISEHEPSLAEIKDRPPFRGSAGEQPLAVVFDPKGRLAYQSPTLPTGEHLLAVLSPAVTDEYLAALQRCGVSYVFAGSGSETDMLQPALQAIGEVYPNVQTLLLEGGGTINGSFLAAGLIDEISLIICPTVDGACGVQNFLDFRGGVEPCPGQGQRLRLLSHEELQGQVIYLHYAVDHS